MFKYKIILLLLSVMAVVKVQAQQVLTLEQAITQAFENNYDIKLEKYNVETNENNVSRSLSGQIPRVDLTASYEWGYSDAELETLNQGDGPNPLLDLDGTSNDLLLRSQVTVPIFQGFRGKYRYMQLENRHRMSEIQLDNVIEQIIAGTVVSYLQVARLQKQLTIDRSNIELSNNRWNRASIDAEYGASNSLRQLQSKVDLNTDSAQFRTTLLDLENAKRNLNVVTGVNTKIDYQVEEDIVLIDNLTYEELLVEMKANNPMLKLSHQGVENAELQSRISNSTMMPTLQGYANIQYFDTDDEASFLQSQTVLGPNVGVQLNFPIFTGGANRIQQQNAKIQLSQQKTSLENTTRLLERDLSNAYAQYINNKEQLRIEQNNLETFEQNFRKVSEDYQLGQVDDTDLRTAQINLSLAKNRINNLKYGVKQSEIRLLQLSGQLRTTNTQGK